MFQRTLKRSIRFSGVGLHTGNTITMTLAPAPAGHGIEFVRSDLRGAAAVVPAQWDNVIDTRMCTVVGNAEGTRIGTIEHIMGALNGCGIDNAVITLDGPEIAIMDGSAAPFVEAIDAAGIDETAMPRRAIRVLKPVMVQEGDKWAELLPGERVSYAFDIDFESAAISRQSLVLDLSPESFRNEIGGARTFGFLHEVEMLKKMGLARGGSLDNAIVISGDRVINAEGLRFQDEFVRHKILDAVGDLYLAGSPIIGRFVGHRSGHALNNKLLRALFADATAWRWDNPLLPVSAWGMMERAVA